jgi:hypothetical protein
MHIFLIKILLTVRLCCLANWQTPRLQAGRVPCPSRNHLPESPEALFPTALFSIPAAAPAAAPQASEGVPPSMTERRQPVRVTAERELK